MATADPIGFDINKLKLEAHSRWLKPSEIFFILQNFDKCRINEQPLDKPQSGSLVLYNRRVLRYFRNDKHVWRKRRNGRNAGEAHEKLKVGNAEVLNCYYAHGDINPYFQRRCYWMLDPAYDHIVLVHYLEVREGGRSSGSNLATDSPSLTSHTSNNTLSESFTPETSGTSGPYHISCSPESVEDSYEFFMRKNQMDNLCSSKFESSVLPSQALVENEIRRIEAQLSLGDDDFEETRTYLGPEFLLDSIEGSQDCGHLNNEGALLTQGDLDNPLQRFQQVHNCNEDQKQFNSSSTQSTGVGDLKQQIQSLGSDYLAEDSETSWNDMLELASNAQVTNSHILNMPYGSRSTLASRNMIAFGQGHPTRLANHQENLGKLAANQPDFFRDNVEDISNNSQHPGNFHLQLAEARKLLLDSDELIESPLSTIEPYAFEERLSNRGPRVDWKETMHMPIDNKIYSLDHPALEVGHTRSLEAKNFTRADKQKFRIREISPEWAFSSESTKVIITGDFLCPSESSWTVMFGDTEVPLEIIQEGVLRCWAPQHFPGKVMLCITSGNREACSETREFVYRANSDPASFKSKFQQAGGTKSTEELLLLARFIRTFLLQFDQTPAQEDITDLGTNPSGLLNDRDYQWQQLTEAILTGSESSTDIAYRLLEELLKDRFHQWLALKHQDCGIGGLSLSKQDYCIIHMLGGLGYEWALNPVLNLGVGVNYRDDRGWTALHWAARFGREKMVAALLASGASAGAVTDPTPQDPVGKTPASIASAYGHKGLAGYLSEVALTSHLSSLTVAESESASEEAERAVESISERTMNINVGATDDQLSLKDSLAAVRNAAQAAARIQSAFRAHSFRKRQHRLTDSHDEYDISLKEIQGISAASRYQRNSHGAREQKSQVAALCIQKKFRGWKGRKNFLALRQNVVKIQAHVRGYQVRQKYKFSMTVSILEKVILRWRRGGVGLRGIRVESESMDEVDEDEILRIFRRQKVDAALDEAVSRVLSVVESPEARQQYRRMLESYHQAKNCLMRTNLPPPHALQ